MSMRVGTSNSGVTRRVIKKPDGTTAGTITVTRINRNAHRKKRLNYNYKKISNQILMSNTSDSARRTAGKARRMVATLKRKLRSYEYDDKEIKNAIIHAEKMERIAKKRKKHIEEEERAEKTGAYAEKEEIEEKAESSESENEVREQETEESEERLRELEQELKKLMEESVEESTEDTMKESLRELADGIVGAAHTNMDKEDIERLKKKHRADELREIIEADMKYLKALFEQLAKEKQEAAGGSASMAAQTGAGDIAGVYLELDGTQMPVQLSEAPVQAEGACVDVSL